MDKPPNMFALVTNSELKLPPLKPTVIRPLLENVLPLVVPMTFKLLLLPLAAMPTNTGPPPINVPPFVMVRLLPLALVPIPPKCLIGCRPHKIPGLASCYEMPPVRRSR